MQRLKGRSAIVTGAGQGIGRGIARRFAREGANVLVAELVEETGRACAAELAAEFGVRSSFVRTDVGVREQVVGAVERTVAEFGSVDILVNNAWGGGTTARLEHKTEAALEHGWRVGLMSAFWAMQAAFPHMRAAGWGRIVSVCSLNGVNAHMYTVEYNVAKEGLRALTRTAAREWGRHGICANIICPAAATLAYEAFRRASPENAAKLLEQNPMGRMGDSEADIAPVVAFLASEDARYVTGNTLFVDGGGHINGVSWAPNLPD
jgi:NAD(P)-dependent dehydrogenase (short-subunit alcohol dehydrogenase family)